MGTLQGFQNVGGHLVAYLGLLLECPGWVGIGMVAVKLLAFGSNSPVATF